MLINFTITGFKRAVQRTNVVSLMRNIIKDICGVQVLVDRSWLSMVGLFSGAVSSANRPLSGMGAKERFAHMFANKDGAFSNTIILGNRVGYGFNALLSSDLSVGGRDRCQSLHPTNVRSQSQTGEPSNYLKGLEPKQFLRSGWYAHIYDDILYDGIYSEAPA